MTTPDPPTLTYWQSLAVAVDEGHLYLDPDAARECDRVCEVYLQRLRKREVDTQHLADVRGYGDFAAGRDLERIFSEKAVGGTNNMQAVMQSHIDVVMEMQAVFKKFFTDTTNTEDTNATDITRNGPR